MIISGELKDGDSVTLTIDEKDELKWDILHLE